MKAQNISLLWSYQKTGLEILHKMQWPPFQVRRWLPQQCLEEVFGHPMKCQVFPIGDYEGASFLVSRKFRNKWEVACAHLEKASFGIWFEQKHHKWLTFLCTLLCFILTSLLSLSIQLHIDHNMYWQKACTRGHRPFSLSRCLSLNKPPHLTVHRKSHPWWNHVDWRLLCHNRGRSLPTHKLSNKFTWFCIRNQNVLFPLH